MQKWKSAGVALLHKGARGPQRISSIGNVKGQNFAHFQNWYRDARLILYDRALLSEKLLFSKLFPKHTKLIYTGLRC